MFKHLFVLILFAMALQIEAAVDKDYHARVDWVRDLKMFVQDMEDRNPEMLTTKRGQEFLLKLSLFEEAYASGNYDCFFAGWPSKLVKSGGKKLCQSPSRGNAEYENGSCKQGQMQCQPLMFGKGVCVGFSSSSQKQLAFSSCEKKFKAKGSYDFLKTLSPEEKTALKEISVLAHDICEKGSVGVQKSKPMCKSLLAKFKDGLKAIDRAPATEEKPEPVEDNKDEEKKEDKKDESSSTPNRVPVPGDADYEDPIPQQDLDEEDEIPVTVVEKKDEVIKQNDDICEPPVVVDKKIEAASDEIIKTVNSGTDQLFEDIKKEFLDSPHCAPEMVLNDPKEKLSPVLFHQVLEEMKFIVETSSYLTRDIKIQKFKELAKGYKLSEDTINYGETMLKNYEDTSAGRFDAMARVRGVMLQDMAEVAKRTPGYEAESIKEGLAERGIFTKDADGFPQCPFVDKDAFRNALAGREAVMKSGNKSSISNPNLITIVDYSKPSNQRRMFVIDLETKKVLHNTWVGQGGGKDRSQTLGTDGKGSNPQTSNEPKSLLSSEGFYIAHQASAGSVYLNNITLKGIDEANTNMGSRAIVVHGWRTPNSDYVAKTWEMSEKPLGRKPGKDMYKEFMSLDFKTTKEDLFNITLDLKNAAAGRDYIDATDGCLGVPDTNMGHADRKGRDKSQLELLREDLPGSLMFNYTGPNTKSKFLK